MCIHKVILPGLLQNPKDAAETWPLCTAAPDHHSAVILAIAEPQRTLWKGEKTAQKAKEISSLFVPKHPRAE